MQRDRRELLQLRDLFGKLIAIGPGLGKDVTDLDKVLSAIGDYFHQTFDLGDGLFMPLSQSIALAVKLSGSLREVCAIFLDINFNELLVEHVMLQAMQHAGLEAIGRDDAVVGARMLPTLLVTRAPPTISAVDCPATAAGSAGDETREDVLRTAVLSWRAALDPSEHELHFISKRIVDDPQLRHVFDQPFLLWIGADEVRAGSRVQHIPSPAEDQLADMEAGSGGCRSYACDRRR